MHYQHKYIHAEKLVAQALGDKPGTRRHKLCHAHLQLRVATREDITTPQDQTVAQTTAV